MTAHLPVRHNRANDELHPLIYRAIIGLTIWFVLSCGCCSVAEHMKV